MKNSARFLGGVLPLAVTALAIWITFPPAGHSQNRQQRSGAMDPGIRAGDPGAGEHLDGLTPGQIAYFEEGEEAFDEIAFVKDPPADGDAGLGPGFNSDSCGSCHAFPALGGSSPLVNPQVAVASKLGARNRIPPFITADGPILEVRFKFNRDGSRDGGVHNLFVISGRSDAAGCNMQQENFSNLSNLSFRSPTPVFGSGLIEAIPDSVLSSNLVAFRLQKASLGINGRLNVNGNDGTFTRFGWKAQNKSLHIFAAEAYNVESGITNPLFPQERAEVPGCMYNNSPEDSFGFEDGAADDITLFAAFMRFLAPPARGPITQSVRDGEGLFQSVGCALCHTPTLRTGRNDVAALSNKVVPLYSDMAVHAMGPGLADDIVQGVAQGDEFRTAPLWGLGERAFLLHDGRTKDLVEAIHAHASPGNGRFRASEANAVVRRFDQLSANQQQNVLNFLRSL